MGEMGCCGEDWVIVWEEWVVVGRYRLLCKGIVV
jgi:hypothetical protein